MNFEEIISFVQANDVFQCNLTLEARDDYQKQQVTDTIISCMPKRTVLSTQKGPNVEIIQPDVPIGLAAGAFPMYSLRNIEDDKLQSLIEILTYIINVWKSWETCETQKSVALNAQYVVVNTMINSVSLEQKRRMVQKLYVRPTETLQHPPPPYNERPPPYSRH